MKDLIQKMLGKLGELKQQANDALLKLKPMEQQEAASEMAWVFRAGRSCLEHLQEIADTAEGKLSEFAEELKAKAKEEVRSDAAFRLEIVKDPAVLESVKQELVKSGDLITKTDMDGKIEAAENAKEKATRELVQNEFAQKDLLTARRGEAVKDLEAALKAKLGGEALTVATEVASKITDEKLKGDGYKTEIAGTVSRVKQCADIGVTKTETLQEVAGMEESIFTKLHGGWQEVAESASKGRARAPFGTPATPPAKAGARDESKPRKLMV